MRHHLASGLTALSLLLAGCTPELVASAQKALEQAAATPGGEGLSGLALGVRPATDGRIRTPRPAFGLKPPVAEPGQPLLSIVGHPDFRTFKPSPDARRLEQDEARVIAQRYLERTRAEEGPDGGWPATARLAEGAPLALQDGFAKGPGAYEFLVTDGEEEDLGHIVVNTSREMLPVPESADEGRGHREALLAAYRAKLGKAPKEPVFYRFSAFSYGVEDATDGTWATSSVGGFDFVAFRAGKRELVELKGQDRYIADRWRELEAPAPTAAGPKVYRLLGTRQGFGREVPRYAQHTYNGCYVGCVPVAWGMVYGYWEQKGRNTVLGARETNFTQNANVEAMHERINGYCSTRCNGLEGVTTWPKQIEGVRWGRQDRERTVDYNPDLYWTDFNMFKTARDAIKVKRPPLLGFDDTPNTNGGGHAVVVTGYYQHDDWGWWDDIERLYINTGWAGTPRLTLTLGSNDLNLRWVITVNVK
ncbi:MAG: hypothetical protein VKS61_09800 [Candidatus Sericytochromatia bacterium]|nr:hypothetical protein [Candidatus Sericytochromatia bacterium]